METRAGKKEERQRDRYGDPTRVARALARLLIEQGEKRTRGLGRQSHLLSGETGSKCRGTSATRARESTLFPSPPHLPSFPPAASHALTTLPHPSSQAFKRTHEHIARPRDHPSLPQQLDDVPELAVNVTADSHWARDRLDVRLLDEDRANAGAEGKDPMFGEVLGETRRERQALTWKKERARVRGLLRRGGKRARTLHLRRWEMMGSVEVMGSGCMVN